jgi:hypothetical protein
MNPLARLRQMRKASRLYESLIKGETTLLVEHFPFVEGAFTVIKTVEVLVPAPVPEKRKLSLPPPKITYRARSEEDDLRDALDIGFGELKFEPLENED